MSSLSGTWSIVSYRKGIETDSPLAIGLQTDKSPGTNVVVLVSNTADENQQWIIKEYKSPIGQTHTVTVQHKVKGWYLAPPTPNTEGPACVVVQADPTAVPPLSIQWEMTFGAFPSLDSPSNFFALKSIGSTISPSVVLDLSMTANGGGGNKPNTPAIIWDWKNGSSSNDKEFNQAWYLLKAT